VVFNKLGFFTKKVFMFTLLKNNDVQNLVRLICFLMSIAMPLNGHAEIIRQGVVREDSSSYSGSKESFRFSEISNGENEKSILLIELCADSHCSELGKIPLNQAYEIVKKHEISSKEVAAKSTAYGAAMFLTMGLAIIPMAIGSAALAANDRDANGGWLPAQAMERGLRSLDKKTVYIRNNDIFKKHLNKFIAHVNSGGEVPAASEAEAFSQSDSHSGASLSSPAY
jgi:hypothetical protein